MEPQWNKRCCIVPQKWQYGCKNGNTVAKMVIRFRFTIKMELDSFHLNPNVMRGCCPGINSFSHAYIKDLLLIAYRNHQDLLVRNLFSNVYSIHAYVNTDKLSFFKLGKILEIQLVQRKTDFTSTKSHYKHITLHITHYITSHYITLNHIRHHTLHIISHYITLHHITSHYTSH